MKYNIQNTLVSIATLSLLLSCAGQNSNPLAKYQGLKSAAPSEEKVETQTIAPPDLFDVQVNGGKDVTQAQFVEGQTSQTLIRVVPKYAQIQKYRIELTDFSSEERPTLAVTKDPNVYWLQWTPPVGSIPGGEPNKPFSAKFLITVTGAENHSLEGLFKSVDLSVIVNCNSAKPLLTISDNLKKNGIDEGAPAVVFTVDVDDPASVNTPRLPSISQTNYIYSNTEAYRADALPYISMVIDPKKENPEKLKGTNTFRFYYALKVDSLPLNRDRLGNEIPASPTVDMCFQMRAVSSVLTWSDEKQTCFTARYAAQAPTLTFNEDQLKSVKSGQDNVIAFTAQVDHPQGTVSISHASTQIAGMSGEKSLDCNYPDATHKNTLSCVLKWKPLCQKTDVMKSLVLKVDNTLDKKMKTTSETKQMTILADPNQCAKPKAGA